jgi:hypothetical protein
VTTFAQLDDTQRAQVAYLFADAHFGTDANSYRYELDRGGNVSGRTPLTIAMTTRARQSAPVIVTVIEEVNTTDEMIQLAHTHMDALAASVAQKLFETQYQEVNNG